MSIYLGDHSIKSMSTSRKPIYLGGKSVDRATEIRQFMYSDSAAHQSVRVEAAIDLVEFRIHPTSFFPRCFGVD